MRTILAGILFSFFILSLGSCYKDVDQVTSDVPSDTVWVKQVLPTHAVNKLSDSLHFSTILDTVDLSNTDTLQLSNNLLLVMPGTWETSTGQPYRGIALVEAQVLLTPGSMLSNGIATRTADAILSAGAVAYVNVRAGNDTLRIGGDNILQVLVPVNDGGASRSLYGCVAGAAGWQWDSLAGGVLTGTTINTAGSVRKAYRFSTHETGWLMCGSPLAPYASTATLNVLLPALYTNANTMCFCIVPGSRVVLPMRADYADRLFTIDKVPVNVPLRIITLSLVDGVYYTGIQNTTLAGDVETFVKPEVQSLQALRSYLSGL